MNEINFTQLTDEQLMVLITQKETKAFDVLYDRYHKKLTWYFYKMLGQCSEKAQDFMHDLFIKVIDQPEKFNSSRKFSTWVFSVAHNMCKNEYRKLEVRKTYATSAPVEMAVTDSSSKEMDNSQFKIQLTNEVNQLETAQRTAFLLRNKYDFSIKQIAETLDCSEGTVKSRLFYTTKKLADTLKIYNPKNN